MRSYRSTNHQSLYWFQIIHPPFVASSFKICRKEDVDKFLCILGIGESAPKAHCIGIVVFACKFRGSRGIDKSATDPLLFVCSDGFTITAPAKENAGAIVFEHCGTALPNNRRIIIVLLEERFDIGDIDTLRQQMFLDLLLEKKAGVI